MLTFKKLLILISTLVIGIYFTSCSNSNHRRSSGTFSSSTKRKNVDHKSKEDKQYVYKSRSTSKSNKDKGTLSPSYQRDEIILTAMKYTGKSYKSGGKTPESGFDCSGFTSFVFNQNGISVSGPSDKQATLGTPKTKNKLQPGDLVFFGNEERISHVAIVASHKNEDIEVIHATSSAGVKIDNITQSDYWNSRFLFGVDVIQK